MSSQRAGPVRCLIYASIDRQSGKIPALWIYVNRKRAAEAGVTLKS